MARLLPTAMPKGKAAFGPTIAKSGKSGLLASLPRAGVIAPFRSNDMREDHETGSLRTLQKVRFLGVRYLQIVAPPSMITVGRFARR